MLKQRREDLNDPHKSLDFGLGQGGGGAKGSRKSLISREKDGSRYNRQQMSMDMNLTSPYLLPPELHGSRESFNSLSKTIHQAEDPYRPVTQYANSEVGSIRSLRKGHDAASVYTRSSSRARSHSRADATPLSPSSYNSPPRQNSLPKPEPSHMRPQPPLPDDFSMAPPTAPPKGPLPPIGTALSSSPRPEDDYLGIGTALQEPPAVAQVGKPMPSPSQPSPADSGVALEYGDVGNPFEKPTAQELQTPTEPSTVGLGLSAHPEPQRASIRTSTSSANSRATSPGPQQQQQQQQQHQQPGAAKAPIIEEPEPLDYYDFDFAEMPEMPRDQQRSPSPAANNHNQLEVDEPRGRNMQRTSHLFEQNPARQSTALGVPQQDNRRLSVGFRPLPPDEIMESEDPEYRANRIRSFYKEYFDDSNKPEDRPPMPAMPPMQQDQQRQQGPPPRPQQQGPPGGGGYPQHQHHQSNTSYYEDYDPAYAQDAPYFDPASNSFVMPYAQPVQRRAMTPPPSGQRFPGPRGPPRAFHGSQAGMKYPQNLRGPPRPGSSVSNQLGGQSRPGSSASGAYGRPRAGSAMSGSRSGSRFGAPRKPLPPPSDLPTLPTPSKLRDDSFALFNATDFAPPDIFAERARGRSQSPSGERRPYKMNVPAHSPLVNAYEELPTLPSP